MSTQTWVQSPMRDRFARVVVLSLVIGYSATAAVHLAAPRETIATIAAKPATASIAPSAPAAPAMKTVKQVAIKSKSTSVGVKQNVEPSTSTTYVNGDDRAARVEAWPTSPNGHLVVTAKDILLTDHRRVRVGDLPFQPVKKALIGFQKTSKSPTVTLTAAADIPDVHVNVVKKFMERFYGWKVTTAISDKPGTFELDVAPTGATP